MAWVTEISNDAAAELRRVIASSSRSDGECVVWTGPARTGKNSSHPYGRVHFRDGDKRRLTGAHRASFLAHKGAIGPGLTVHHECYNTLCVNPDHLSLLTLAENLRDGNPGRKPLSPKWEVGERSQCKHGHAWNAENVRWDKRGYPHCKVCASVRFRKHLASKKLAPC